MKGFLVSLLALSLAVACNPSATRPNYRPFRQALADTVDADAEDVMAAARDEVIRWGMRISRFSARQGYLETHWFDMRDSTSAGNSAAADSVIQLRIWSDLVQRGQSDVRVEAVYRATLDPSLSGRDALTPIPPGHAGNALARAILAAITETFRR